jgi:AbrB family looped-hinge helix DNA binding protein
VVGGTLAAKGIDPGFCVMVAEPTLVRIQSNGQVPLPAAVRERLGLKAGDLVAVAETPDGVLISPRERLVSQSLDRIGAILREEGLTLDELIASGREERDALLRELYGIEPTA